MGQDSLQVPFDHLGSSVNWLERFSGFPSHRVHPSAPVSEQLRCLAGILPLVDTLKLQPQLVRHSRHTPFKSYRLPFLGFFLRPVDPVLEPHPTGLLQPISLPGFGPVIGHPDLVARLHDIVDDKEPSAHHSSVPEVVACPLAQAALMSIISVR